MFKHLPTHFQGKPKITKLIEGFDVAAKGFRYYCSEFATMVGNPETAQGLHWQQWRKRINANVSSLRSVALRWLWVGRGTQNHIGDGLRAILGPSVAFTLYTLGNGRYIVEFEEAVDTKQIEEFLERNSIAGVSWEYILADKKTIRFSEVGFDNEFGGQL